jgi:hypothetical protein
MSLPYNAADDMTSFPSRPLTDQETEAAEHDVPRSERVYAPASERVPKPPAPGHRELVEHPDQGTPERRATQPGSSTRGGTVRTTHGRRRVRIPIGSAAREEEDATTRQVLALGLGWFGLFTGGAVGMWMYLRWQHQRNRPVNRLRRQARWAAEEIRDRVPPAPETSTTAMRVAAALLSTALVVWRRMHARQEPERHQPRAIHSSRWGRSWPMVVSRPWPG